MDFQIWIFYLDQILIYATLALSLNLLLGYAGQVSVAHAAFGAIGGYTHRLHVHEPRHGTSSPPRLLRHGAGAS